MKFKPYVLLLMALFSISVIALPPTIQLRFLDPTGLCKTTSGDSSLAFNYKYVVNNDLAYYSGPTFTHFPAQLLVPPPQNLLSGYQYTDFEITDEGDCGQLAFDYQTPGECFLKNLIPKTQSSFPLSYRITFMPQITQNDPFGAPLYHLTCRVERMFR
ncbi:MAG: hypothetical protein QM752_05545 [Gammaproteobacteria bacterium]